MTDFILYTPSEMAYDLAGRIRRIRKRKKITQVRLSELSGVSYASLRKFERTGEVSLLSFIKIASALGLSDEINSLFTKPVYSSIEEVIRDGR